MAKIRNGLIASLDIGSTKVVCLIARLDNFGGINIVGIGHQVSHGISAGVVTDIQALETSVLGAINAAENMAGENIERVLVNLSGGKPTSTALNLEIPINSEHISERDITRIINMGMDQCKQADRTIIQCIPVEYTIDGQSGIKDPKGMFGNQLGAKLLIISVSSTTIANLTNCLARCHLDIDDFIVSSYASGIGCLTDDEKELGATIIDMGGSCTNIGVFWSWHSYLYRYGSCWRSACNKRYCPRYFYRYC